MAFFNKNPSAQTEQDLLETLYKHDRDTWHNRFLADSNRKFSLASTTLSATAGVGTIGILALGSAGVLSSIVVAAAFPLAAGVLFGGAMVGAFLGIKSKLDERNTHTSMDKARDVENELYRHGFDIPSRAKIGERLSQINQESHSLKNTSKVSHPRSTM